MTRPAGDSGERWILHVDMDAFFASVEQLDEPALRGKPVLVGHDGRRGVVTAASYEAREFGCHSAQPMAVAKRQCPHAIVRPGRFARYRELSEAMFEILHAVTPVVEPLSIDEAFLDVTGSQRLFGAPPTIARRIKDRIAGELGLTASVGVAANKFLAKLASDWEKPDGLTVIEPAATLTRLAPLPIGRMWGVGPAQERRLRAVGIGCFGDLQRMTQEDAERILGSGGAHFWRLARGADSRRVVRDSRARSIGHEQTFGIDVESRDHLRGVLLRQTEHVAERLRRAGLRARTVSIKVRFGDFQTIARSVTLRQATDRTDALWPATRGLFDAWAKTSFVPVRLIGVSTSNMASEPPAQLELFPDEAAIRGRKIDATTDAIHARFGRGSIGRGVRTSRGRGSGPSGS
ncbi:MAG: DNA polymerase IV [Phycisphaerales bacterium]|nr:DNA polymerase IV [Phycisphaerales bacterium]